MIRGHGVQPRAKRPAGVILRKLLPDFDENIHGGVFGVFASGHRPAAETKYRGPMLAIKRAPSLRVPGLGQRNPLLDDGLFRGTHPLGMSPRIHQILRTRAVKYFMCETLRADHASDYIPRLPSRGHGETIWRRRAVLARGEG